MVATGLEDRNNARIARVFFEAATKASQDSEDILPQEGGSGEDLSVFNVFSILFPEMVGIAGAGGQFCVRAYHLLSQAARHLHAQACMLPCHMLPSRANPVPAVDLAPVLCFNRCN